MPILSINNVYVSLMNLHSCIRTLFILFLAGIAKHFVFEFYDSAQTVVIAEMLLPIEYRFLSTLIKTLSLRYHRDVFLWGLLLIYLMYIVYSPSIFHQFLFWQTVRISFHNIFEAEWMFHFLLLDHSVLGRWRLHAIAYWKRLRSMYARGSGDIVADQGIMVFVFPLELKIRCLLTIELAVICRGGLHIVIFAKWPLCIPPQIHIWILLHAVIYLACIDDGHDSTAIIVCCTQFQVMINFMI